MRMRWVRNAGLVCACAFGILLGFPRHACAQKNELGLSLGRVLSGTRSAAEGAIDVGSGLGLQANYARRIAGGDAASLYLDVHLLASPQRKVETLIPGATTDVATLYLTPGLKVKFLPRRAISPYAVAGGGWALYEQSRLDNTGQPNTAPRTVNRGVFTYGGGIDVRTLAWLSLRAEYRGFYSGSPAYAVTGAGGGQHNPVFSAGFVLRWGK